MINILSFTRKGFIPSFLFLFLFLNVNFGFAYDTKKENLNKILEKIENLKLYENPVWKALLHYDPKNKNSFITDKNFLLSLREGKFSLKREMELTVEALLNNKDLEENSNPVCKFPARLYWLKLNIPELNDLIPEVKCKDLNTYLEKVSVDKITLVFAAEDIKNPSSMMGHVFLKLTGYNKEGIYVEHAVSYFAVIDTVNPIKLLVKSTITGMDSFFSLKPYRKFISRYLLDEERVIWEFPLKDLNDEKKEIIRLHIWELKDVKTKYYFTEYNCATVIYYILSIADPKMLEEKQSWISPRDVIRIAKKVSLIDEAELIPTDEWLIRILEDKISFKDLKKIKKSISLGHCDNSLFENTNYTNFEYKFYIANLYENYITFLKRKERISNTQAEELSSCIPSIKGYTIDLTNYKNPYNAPLNSKVSLGYSRFNDKDYLHLVFTPTYNTILDNNRQVFLFETDLRLFEFSLLLNKSNIKIDHIYLYHIYSLKPYSLLTGGLSYNFKIGLENHYQKLDPKLSLFTSTGLGITLNPHKDFYIFFLQNVGIGYGKNTLYPYTYPELGLIVYEIFNMKSVLSYKYMFNQFNSKQSYNILSLNHVINLKSNLQLILTLDYLKDNHKNKTNFFLNLTKNF
ncbi:conserved hypothetical protein [Sulfurihydrogenibium azorense Az-Fu1]|uniref:Uncharacterized protein n=1 Tax=Sulfurihydrogenibium azorense (strain DSM 15241 / OCM 825 / Az-Fu1) TaxID=204536 RepID=C1DTX8_SULAA|nr:DUF4105 domain-containing protein [Sulfurihydrogenibium azorense]ACN98547.1 conserved hypothetical protein [Sulfurihydrogenibium azorense Az-Fu1]